MRLVNEFTVDATPSRCWEVLSDVETVVLCVPGGEIVGRHGDDYDGVVTVKVGPVSMRLSGVVTVTERDGRARRLVVRGRAKDVRGQGGVAATITVDVSAGAAGGSGVSVVTDLDLSGPVGQLGAGMVRQVNRRLIGQFTTRLQALLDEGGAHPGQEAGVAEGSSPQRLSGHARGPAVSASRVLMGVAVREGAAVVVGGVLLGVAISRALRRSGG